MFLLKAGRDLLQERMAHWWGCYAIFLIFSLQFKVKRDGFGKHKEFFREEMNTHKGHFPLAKPIF